MIFILTKIGINFSKNIYILKKKKRFNFLQKITKHFLSTRRVKLLKNIIFIRSSTVSIILTSKILANFPVWTPQGYSGSHHRPYSKTLKLRNSKRLEIDSRRTTSYFSPVCQSRKSGKEYKNGNVGVQSKNYFT